MTTSQTPQTQASSSKEGISVGDIAYYNQRLRNQIFANVLEAFAEEAKAGRITKATLAKRLGKKPEQITRWFSGPSNWTLDTISTLLLGLDAELDTKVVFFRNLTPVNYAHPLVDQIMTSETLAELEEQHHDLQLESTSRKASTGSSPTPAITVISVGK